MDHPLLISFESLEFRQLLTAVSPQVESRLKPDVSSAPMITASSTTLSKPRFDLGTASVDGEAIFAGGMGSVLAASNQVDIFDSLTENWSTASISNARSGPAGTTIEGIAMFAAGDTHNSTVDVYDGATGAWSTQTLPMPLVTLAATAAGDEAVFLGSNVSTVGGAADIYNAASGTWSSKTLPRLGDQLSATSVGQLAFFGSVLRSTLDVYDAATGAWSTMKLPAAMSNGISAAASVGTEAVFAGYSSNVVGIYNTLTNQWSTVNVSLPQGDISATTLGTKVLFGGGDAGTSGVGGRSSLVNIYDASTGIWSTTSLSVARDSAAAATVGTKAIFAGGETSYLVPSDAVDIFTDNSPNSSLNGNIERGAHSTVSVMINNIGDASLPIGYSVAIYASTDRSFGRGAALVGTASLSQPLATGATTSVNVATSLPNDLPVGQYDLLAVVAPSTRGHATSIASILGAFSIRGPRHSFSTASTTLADTVNLHATPFSTATIAPDSDVAKELASAGGNVLA